VFVVALVDPVCCCSCRSCLLLLLFVVALIDRVCC
jgi:hypothetical protein